MKADAISQKILDDARAAAARILEEARARAEDLRHDAETKTEERRVTLDAQTEEDSRLLRSRMLRMAELDQRKALLGAKREVIEQVFETALAGMRNMPEAQRVAYNKQLLLSAAQGGEQVIVAADEARLFDDRFIQDVNAELKQAGKGPVSLSSEHRQTGGGFILASQGMEINCTYQAVLGQAKPSLEAEVAQMLFGA